LEEIDNILADYQKRGDINEEVSQDEDN